MKLLEKISFSSADTTLEFSLYSNKLPPHCIPPSDILIDKTPVDRLFHKWKKFMKPLPNVNRLPIMITPEKIHETDWKNKPKPREDQL